MPTKPSGKMVAAPVDIRRAPIWTKTRYSPAPSMRAASSSSGGMAPSAYTFARWTAYVRTTLDAFNAAVASVRATIGTADDRTFLAGLAAVQDAVKGLRLLNPTLTGDGSIDYPSPVTSSLSATAVGNMVDGDINTYSGDLKAPFTLDFGAGFRVRASAFGLQSRYNFANRSQGANVHGSDDGRTWTLLTARETVQAVPSALL